LIVNRPGRPDLCRRGVPAAWPHRDWAERLRGPVSAGRRRPRLSALNAAPGCLHRVLLSPCVGTTCGVTWTT